MKRISFLFFLLGLFFFPSRVLASDQLPSLSVINQIRGPQLGLEKADLLASLKGQYSITKKYDVKATWLWQYSALEDQSLVSFAKQEMKDQEMGVFLEIDRNFAQKSGVLYRGQGPWYFSDGLFLFSYDQSERKKYIDVAFSKFHEIFGYYPKSIGAWWIDAWSLSYMHERYGVTSSLRAADQLDLDVYSIWGTPWSISYLAAKENAGIPGRSVKESSGVLMLQWASRDPLLGYASSPSASLYSLQDYFHFKDNAYFEDLLMAYLQGPTKNAVIGLEGGYAPAVYQGMYERHLSVAKSLESSGSIRIVPASEYAAMYFSLAYKDGAYLLREDKESGDQAFWYQSSSYRIGIKKSGNILSIVDIRDYAKMPSEEYYLTPNTQGYLRIDEPSLLDSSRFHNDQKIILENAEKLSVNEEGNVTMLFSGDKKVGTFTDSFYELPTGKEVFSKSSYSGPILGWFGVAVGYILLAGYMLRKKKAALAITLSMFVPLILSLYYLQYLMRDILLFIFDVKMLLFSPLLLLPFSISANIILGFFVIPFVILFVLHYFFFIRRSHASSQLFSLAVIAYVFVYLKLPYFPLTKKSALFAGSCILAILVVKSICLLRKKRNMRDAKFGVLTLLLSTIFLGVVVIFSRQEYILNPFEIHALEEIKSSSGKAIFLESSTNVIYKASAPLLWKYPLVTQFITQKLWEYRNDFIKPSDGGDQEIVFVPRYLGSHIDAKGIREHLFKPIFDNSSIVLYKK